MVCGETDEEQQPQDPTMYGQTCGSIRLMQRSGQQNKNGSSRKQSSIMPDSYVVSSSLNLRMKNSDTSSKMLVESLKFRCQRQCLVRHHSIATGKRAAVLGKARPNMFVLSMPRIRLEGVPNRYHEDHISAKGINALSHYNLVHKFILMPQALKNSGCEGSSGKRRGKLEKIPAWQLTKIRNKKKVIEEARNKGRKVHFASLMDLCHLDSSELEPQFQKYKGGVVLQGDIVKDDSGSYAVFTEQGSSASQLTAAKINGYHIQIAGLRWTSS